MPFSANKSTASASFRDLSDEDLLTQAFLAANLNQPERAIDLFREASFRDPKDPFALLEMAKCYRRLHQLQQMRDALFRVKKLAKKDTLISLAYARACEAMRDMDEAMAAYEGLSKLRGARAVAEAGQVVLLERLNRLEQAEDVIKGMGHQGRQHPSVRLTEARIAYRQGDYDRAGSVLRSLIRSEKSVRAEAGYVLAGTLDKQQKYDEAIEALERVKRPLRSSQDAMISRRAFHATRDKVTRALEEFSDPDSGHWQDLRVWREEASGMAVTDEAPLAFLVGHPRSGTTLLEQALDAHNAICSADETAAFHDRVWMPLAVEASREHGDSLASVFEATAPARWQELQSQYLNSLSVELSESRSNEGLGKVWIDKNPALTLQLLVVMRVLPEAKLLVALRDPRDVVISAYMQSVQLTNWSVNWLSLEDTVEMYAVAMKNWLQLREQTDSDWIEVRYEDCVEDLPREGRRATEFLGLDWQETQATPHEHVKQKAVFSPTYGDVATPVYRSSVARWRSYEKHLEPFQEKLAPFVDAFGYDRT